LAHGGQMERFLGQKRRRKAMMKMRWRFISVVLTMALVTLNSSVFAWDLEQNQTTMKGIKAVTVKVSVTTPEDVREFLVEDQLQTMAELKLRKWGIKIIPKTPGCQTLYLEVLGKYREPPGIYLCVVSVQLLQWVKLERNPKISVYTETWSDEFLAYGSTPNAVASYSQKGLEDLVDKFINVYLTVNPKR